jgi:hypothetical protein
MNLLSIADVERLQPKLKTLASPQRSRLELLESLFDTCLELDKALIVNQVCEFPIDYKSPLLVKFRQTVRELKK